MLRFTILTGGQYGSALLPSLCQSRSAHDRITRFPSCEWRKPLVVLDGPPGTTRSPAPSKSPCSVSTIGVDAGRLEGDSWGRPAVVEQEEDVVILLARLLWRGLVFFAETASAASALRRAVRPRVK